MPQTYALFICDSPSGEGHYTKWWCAPNKGILSISQNVKGKFAFMCTHGEVDISVAQGDQSTPKRPLSLPQQNQGPFKCIHIFLSHSSFNIFSRSCTFFSSYCFHPLTRKYSVDTKQYTAHETRILPVEPWILQKMNLWIAQSIAVFHRSAFLFRLLTTTS